jgi:two-component system OmpR family sensor kinase
MGDAGMRHHTSRYGDSSSDLISLRSEIEDLKLALQARDDFIAITAHELRNPMTPLLGISQMALNLARRAEPPVPPSLLSLLDRMRISIQEFVDRTTRLLDLSRINAGNLQLNPVEMDLSAAVGTIAGKYENSAIRRGSVLHMQIERGVSAVLDPLALTQIVENLLSNAFKFGGGKPVLLCLAVENGWAKLSIEDSGIGMDAEQQKHIFGRFKQVALPPLGGGIGIGLWLTGRLVAAMKGRIDVVSQAGRGSKFTVLLPLRQ